MASQKPPQSTSDSETTQANQGAPETTTRNQSQNKYTDEARNLKIVTAATEEVPSRAWYGGGSWPRIQKSNPSIQVVKESILAGKSGDSPIPADAALFGRKGLLPAQSSNSSVFRPPSMDPGKSKETLKLVSGEPSTGDDSARGATSTNDTASHCLSSANDHSIDTPQESQTLENTSKPEANDIIERQVSAGWLEWLRPAKVQGLVETREVVRLRDESPPAEEDPYDASVDGKTLQSPPTSTCVPDTARGAKIATEPSRLWPGIWPVSSTRKVASTLGDTDGQDPVESESIMAKDNSQVHIKPELTMGKVNEQSTNPSRAASSWAFWSRQAPNSGQKTDSDELGELAVTGEPSQEHPITAHSNGPQNSKAEPGMPSQKGNSSSEIVGKDLPRTESLSKPVVAIGSPHTKSAPNLLLPLFRNTYHLAESPSIIQQIARLLFRSRQPQTNHLFLVKDPPKIKRAIAIGIHGLFPAALLRTVIGQPTGTSIRFANHGAAAIERWAKQHGCHCDIEKIALEGEGKIAERVDHLWKLLLNWIDHVRRAEFILVSCHSQGVPVAMMITAKLISLGVVNSARIGICAMAGVSLGPFPDYKSRFFSGSAAELFDFADPESEVSRSYHEALSVALKYGVRVAYIGSIDDQLVSLESAVFSPVDHPYIYRSVFVDGRIHAPDFITNLVGFALKLRNLGVSDHQLIKALSAPLAGSLYTGEGHSRLYDEEGIYDLAVQFALETTSIDQDIDLKVQRSSKQGISNPSQLPWSMRGLLEEDVVKTELDQEARELLLQFEEWKPSTKVLKDVKYRLEVIKSKL